MFGGFFVLIVLPIRSYSMSKPMYSMKAPDTAITVFDETMMSEATAASRESVRKRIILPLQKKEGALLQRMLNAIQPGSYIRPHRHAPDRGESIIVLRGCIIYYTFKENGDVESMVKLQAGTSAFGVDIEGGVWHSFMAVDPDTVLFEVKPGPYNPEADKEFAEWAPEEFSPEAEAYLEVLLQYSTTSL
jgi:cupin fold WbuC family metalloprotein